MLLYILYHFLVKAFCQLLYKYLLNAYDVFRAMTRDEGIMVNKK